MEGMFLLVFFLVYVLVYVFDFNQTKKINKKLQDRKNRRSGE
jgi:cbb3-type cytochrome oxidase subunit 3